MIKEENSFLLAITSINITFFLKKYFHLANEQIYTKESKELCPRIALKHFCTLLIFFNNSNHENFNENAFTYLHNYLLRKVFEEWMKKK